MWPLLKDSAVENTSDMVLSKIFRHRNMNYNEKTKNYKNLGDWFSTDAQAWLGSLPNICAIAPKSSAYFPNHKFVSPVRAARQICQASASAEQQRPRELGNPVHSMQYTVSWAELAHIIVATLTRCYILLVFHCYFILVYIVIKYSLYRTRLRR